MTTERQRAANRANASLSTGPKTVPGKSASSRNSRIHGLAGRSVSDFGYAEKLAKALVGSHEGLGHEGLVWHHALTAAEATFELARVRQIRANMIAQIGLGLAGSEVCAMTEENAYATVARLERYERRAYSRRKSAMLAIERSPLQS